SRPATNSRRPVRKSSTTLTSTPSALSRWARGLPMNPPPPVTQARFTRCPRYPRLPRSEREAGGDRVAVEHLHGLQRVFVEVVPEQGELLQEVVGDRDDVAADLVGLDDVEDLSRRGPDQLRLRRRFHHL